MILSSIGIQAKAAAAARTIAINFYGNSSPTYGGTNWNNVQSAAPTVSGSNLIYLDNGANSGLGISFTFDNAGSVADNGTPYCASPSNGFPTEVHRYTLFDVARTITISGCNNAKTYDVIFLGTRSTATHSLTITSQTKSDTWEAANNCSDMGTILTLTPSSGNISVACSINTGSFFYFTACYIIEH